MIGVDDLITVLANRALVRSGLSPSGKVEGGGQAEQTEVSLVLKQRQQQVDEMMKILPNLQYGLDVNLRFTKGVMGAEFTAGLTAFDALGVDLVHGWLVDPTENEGETFRLIGSRSYNEVVELVIDGNEATSDIDQLSKLISEKEEALTTLSLSSSDEKKVVKNDVEEPALLFNDVKEVTKSTLTQSWTGNDDIHINTTTEDVDDIKIKQNMMSIDDVTKVAATSEAHNSIATKDASILTVSKSDVDKPSLSPSVDATADDKKSFHYDAQIERNVTSGDDVTQVTVVSAAPDEDVSNVSQSDIQRQSLFPSVDDVVEDKQCIHNPPYIFPSVNEIIPVHTIKTGLSETKAANSDGREQILADLDDLRGNLATIIEKARIGRKINQFLNETGHQLTYYGLKKLCDHLKEEELCVFFRNNHFSTLGKKNSKLYLLVTDLGYASVEEVVWEKLDNIKGDTDYVDCFFQKPQPRSDNAPTRILDPEQMLAQKGQHELDYQLAMRLQSGKKIDDVTLNNEEAALVAAATERSLNEWNGSTQEKLEVRSMQT